jgi:hypothetical protein
VNRKFIGYFRLVEACEQAGCPVCTALENDSRRALDALLYEHVTDGETRRRLRQAWGLCGWHAASLLDGKAVATGAAILFEDLLRVCEEAVERLASRSAPASRSLLAWIRRPVPPLVANHRSLAPCPVCETLQGAEEAYLEAVVDFADDPQFSRAYGRSTGLCVPHIVGVVDRHDGKNGVGTIVQATLRKWRGLRTHLERFVAKHEYRSGEPISQPEASSWRLASEVLAGRPGIFGSHMRVVPDCRVGTVEEPPVSDGGVTDEFVRRKLELRVQELTRQLSDEATRAAALHYRLAQVSRDRNALELNFAAERGATAIAERALADLRNENERLRAELVAARVEQPPQAEAG